MGAKKLLFFLYVFISLAFEKKYSFSTIIPLPLLTLHCTVQAGDREKYQTKMEKGRSLIKYPMSGKLLEILRGVTAKDLLSMIYKNKLKFNCAQLMI